MDYSFSYAQYRIIVHYQVNERRFRYKLKPLIVCQGQSYRRQVQIILYLYEDQQRQQMQCGR